jgi:hypothetical protein
LRELESKYSQHLVVIGVQSGKYHAERVTSRIRDASIRLNAVHPLLNDRQFRVWRSYAVSAWPTLVAIDPAGYVVGAHAGEFKAEMLIPFIDGLIEKARADGTLSSGQIAFDPEPPTIAPGKLRYPEKVAVDGDRIAVADTGNNRVIMGRLDRGRGRATIERIAGTGSAGFENGASGTFRSPTGVAFNGSELLVADTENHSIRAVDISSGEITTVSGNGRQLRTRRDQLDGSMSSPWDLVVEGSRIYVAMAGIHQLWTVDRKTGASRVHSGTGGEDIRDGASRDALLAQPMGIARHDERLYFADAESNAVRWADDSGEGSVGTIVGTGLFDFGDVDGAGDDVRLQHPQGICAAADGSLLIADSYNDAIKLIDPSSRTATAWIRGLHEPGGVACNESDAFIADTNAHRILVVDLKTKEERELTIE